jgi:hypothetical protein
MRAPPRERSSHAYGKQLGLQARDSKFLEAQRAEIFGEDFPASAAITVSGFALSKIMIEAQGVAVAE